MEEAKRGIFRGPNCAVCQKMKCDGGQTVCYRCRNQFALIDNNACSARHIKSDMIRTGTPVNGLSAAFSRELWGPRAAARRTRTGLHGVMEALR